MSSNSTSCPAELRHKFISAFIVAGQNGFGYDLDPFLALSHETWDEEQLWDAVKDLPHGPLLRTRLMFAAQSGDERRLRWLLARGARLDTADARGRTALWWAASAGRARAVAELLRRGADAARGSPLLAAARGGHEGVALALLDGGAPLLRSALAAHVAGPAPGVTAPLLSALCSRAGVVGARVERELKEIVAAGLNMGSFAAPPPLPARTLRAAVTLAPALAASPHVLFAACLRCGEEDACAVLRAARRAGALDAPVLPLAPSYSRRAAAARSGATPLGKALHEGRADIVAALVRAGAAVDGAHLRAANSAPLLEALLLTPFRAEGAGGGAPPPPAVEARLLAGAAVGSTRVLRALLGGAAAEAEGEDAEGGEVGAAAAAGEGEGEEGGGGDACAARAALPSAADERGHTPLMLAAAGAHFRAAAMLLRCGAPASSRAGGASALALAAGAGDGATVAALLAAGARAGAEGAADAADAVLRAAAGGHAAALLALCAADGALVHARDASFFGRTPLHWAASGGHRGAVAALLARGARADAVAHGSPGKTPADLAKAAGHSDLAAQLRKV
jgi:ankyrin repeat protein